MDLRGDFIFSRNGASPAALHGFNMDEWADAQGTRCPSNGNRRRIS